MKNITNVKISCIFKLPEKWRKLLQHIVIKRNAKVKKTANITIIRDVYVFCIFERKDGYVHFNVTKIKSIADIYNFLFFFSDQYFTYDTILKSLKIDNITSNFTTKDSINLQKINSQNLNVKFNPERFAGYFIKFVGGTAIIFRSGKINIVGCKTVSAINEICLQLKKILHVSIM